MFLAFRPNSSEIVAFIEMAERSGFSYHDIGATVADAPAGYNIDHNRQLIGRGMPDFEKAADAIRSWKMFDTGWTTFYPANAEIEPGQTVAILVKHFGIWSLNAARIVYTIDERGPNARFGFAYGTLADHAETGEERFSIELHTETGEVWYDLYAFSKPNHLLAKIGYPISRMLQKQFAIASKQAMNRAAGSRPSNL